MCASTSHTLLCWISLFSLWSKMPMFQRMGMRQGGEPLPLAFQNLILMIWRPWDLKFDHDIFTSFKMPRSHPLEHSACTYFIKLDYFVNITLACRTPILVSISSPARRTTFTYLPIWHFTVNWAKSYDVGFVFDQVLHFPRGPFIYYVSSYFGLDKFWYFWT